MRGNSIYQAFVGARSLVGVDIGFHDLRHTGQSMAASTGATVVDLKKAIGACLLSGHAALHPRR
jgi:integrase